MLQRKWAVSNVLRGGHRKMAASIQPRGDDSSERRSKKIEIASAITVAAIAALGATGAALVNTQPWHHENSCTNNLTITSPSAGQAETGGNNEHILVKGAACDMNGKTGWLFWQDTDGTYYLEYFNNPPVPTVTSDGYWSYTIKDLGNPGDKNQQYGIAVVLASPLCTNELERAKPDSNGDIGFKVLPSGCQVDYNVDVNFTYS
jgi:hypothetical protein